MSEQREIDAVLFDFGGVFTESPFAALSALGDTLDADPRRLMELVFGSYHEDTQHPWHRLERGETSLAAARREIIALGEAEGLDTDPFRVFALLGGGGAAREALVARVRTLGARGFRTGLVTNNVVEFKEAWRRLLPVDELFDVVVDSSEVGVRKPSPEIFRIALTRLGGIEPRHAVFLDDFPGNVAAACALGLRGVLVEPDPRAALIALDALLDVGPRTRASSG